MVRRLVIAWALISGRPGEWRVQALLSFGASFPANLQFILVNVERL